MYFQIMPTIKVVATFLDLIKTEILIKFLFLQEFCYYE